MGTGAVLKSFFENESLRSDHLNADMAEGFNATDSKSVEANTSSGSNPDIGANMGRCPSGLW